ncbi:MAG: DUF4395 domain-containing protein [Campylobacterales bacterium]|nr:DUF4395 domain-containing protein [Campylobacterales bacterium]
MKGKMMSQFCPISSRRVDANMVRVISFEVALFSIAFLLTQETLFAWVLLFDFTARLLRINDLSLFQIIGKLILSASGSNPKLCDESPKRFALYLGFSASLLLVSVFMSGLVHFAYLIAILLFIAALLETVFDFCIGCKLYYAIELLKGKIYHDRNFF